ncbi:MAG: hypothetical protein ACYTXE_40000 [Nostoc sp.]
MASIQITDLNSSDSEFLHKLSEQESQGVVGGAAPADPEFGAYNPEGYVPPFLHQRPGRPQLQ